VGTAAETWRTRPLYDIEKVAVFKKLVSAGRELVFAELTLDGQTLRYSMSSPASEWRIQTLFTKEPGTIDWLRSFRRGDVYVDVGANVGMYGMYAGVIAGARVYAFEPEAQNFAELCRSIYLNAAHETIVAYCAAICDVPIAYSRLLLNDMRTGLSYHDFGEPSRPYDQTQRFAQGCVGFSLDHLVQSGAIPVPDHVKIDVDKHERKVIDRMRGLLESRAIRTLLLECDPALPHTRDIVSGLLRGGWQVNPDQVRLTRTGIRPADAAMAEVVEGVYGGNIIFGRSAEDLAFASRALERFSPEDLERMGQAA